jgi:hypothetical protein
MKHIIKNMINSMKRIIHNSINMMRNITRTVVLAPEPFIPAHAALSIGGAAVAAVSLLRCAECFQARSSRPVN